MQRVCLIPSWESSETETVLPHTLCQLVVLVHQALLLRPLCNRERLARRRGVTTRVMSSGALSNGQRQSRPHPHVTSKCHSIAVNLTKGRSHKAGGNSYYMLATRLPQATSLYIPNLSEILPATGLMPSSTNVWTIGRRQTLQTRLVVKGFV